MKLHTQTIGLQLCERTRTAVEQATRQALGRLARRVRNAKLVIAVQAATENAREKFVCELRLALEANASLVVRYHGDSHDAVVAGASRRARHALSRRPFVP